MGSDLRLHHRLLLIVSLSSLFFIHSSKALYVPHNSTTTTARPKIQNNPTVAAAPAPNVTTSPPPVTVVPSTPSASRPRMKPFNAVHPKVPSVAAAIVKVTHVCRATDYPALCLSSLKPYLDGKTDLISLFYAEIQASKNITVDLIAKAEKKSRDPKLDRGTVSILQNCKNPFELTMNRLEEAEVAMKTGNFNYVNDMLNSALTEFGYCDDMIGEGKNGPLGPSDGEPDPVDPAIVSMMTKDDKTFRNLMSNCRAIASLVRAHHH